MEKLYKYFPDKLVNYLKNYNTIKDITEIRLRIDNTVQFTEKGKIKDTYKIYITEKEIEEIFYSMCEFSQNAYEDDISNGFVTLPDGYRVGIGGDFYYNDINGKYILKKLYSLNIRIPQKSFYFKNQDNLFKKNPVSTLIIGPPHSGKTSLIKIYTEHLMPSKRLCICDERGEIFVKNLNCDVIKGVKKATAISMATRTLNPQFIICDEISDKDAKQILSAVNTGVGFICSAHGLSIKEISKAQGINMLIQSKVFKRFVMLSEDNSFCIKEITDV